MRPDQASTYVAQIEFAFSRYGERIAFVEDDGRQVTYSEAYDRIRRFIPVFTNLDITKGKAVACLSANCVDMYLAELAVTALGGRYSGLHSLSSTEEHAWLCDDAEIDALIVDPAYIEQAKAIVEHMTNRPALVTLGPSSTGVDLLAEAADALPVPKITGVADVRQDDLARLIYTGGTTGRPKGVEFTHGAIAHMFLNGTRVWQMPEVPRYLATGPITHGTSLMLMPTLLSGGCIIFHKGFEPERWLRAIESEGVNLTFVVPTMLYAALDSPVISEVDLSSIQTIAYGGSPMSPTRLVDALERFGPVFTQFYGQTECLAQGTNLMHEEHDPERLPHLLTSCGRPVPGVVVEVVDADDVPVPNGEPGEIVIRAATTMRGYWKQPELTAETLRNGWLHTGDIAVRDENGYYYIVDRKKDMIITGGFNVFPREIEDILTAHPAIAHASVIGVPHDRWGEQVTAVVVTNPGEHVTETELQQLVKTKKGSHYAPKEIVFVDELPWTAVGKIDKAGLRKKYWTGTDRNVH